MPTVNAYHYQKPNAANSCKNKKLTHKQYRNIRNVDT